MALTERVHVLDACSGYGLVWSELEKHVTIKRWVRCDIKPRPGQNESSMLRLSAIQSMQSMPLEEFNVIDIDMYGDPWEPYFVLLKRLKTPMVVFLTHGRVVRGADTSNFAKSTAGLPYDWPTPQLPHVVDYIAQRCLEATWLHAEILHAAQVYSAPGQARAAVNYYALAIRPWGYIEDGPTRAIDLSATV